MSLVTKEERPKLKPKRFNKFEPSSSDFKTEEDTNNIPKRGYKRVAADEENYSGKRKRICVTPSTINTTTFFNYSSSPVKNLANNRLKKLKEQIQAETHSNVDNKNEGNLSTTTIFHSNREYRDDVSPKLTKKDIVSPNQSRKNLAQDRLKNIKTRLSIEDKNPKSKPQSSPALQKSDTEMKSVTVNQPATQTLNTGNNQGNAANPVVGCSSNFLNKMEMTASWIRNHRDQINFPTSTEASDNPPQEKTERNEVTIIDESDEMEWTNAEPDSEVVDTNKNQIETTKEDEDGEKIIKDPEKIKDVCIVVDTNVFMSGLSKIRDIVNLKTNEIFNPVIFVPWMVITELDYMKDSCSHEKLLKNILSAIKFINGALQSKNPRVVGQTVFDVDKQKHVGTSPDDKIVSCCLQVQEKYETVMLLSNDINLKNKAMINNIAACSSNEIMMKLMSKLGKNTKYQKIMNKMGIMCSSVICDCMKVAYGDVWLRMDMMSHPPWSLMECLKRFKKYWSSVFREKLMKQFTKALQDLRNTIETNKWITDDSEEFVEFMKLCVTLCVFLKDIEECRGFVENTLAEITKTA